MVYVWNKVISVANSCLMVCLLTVLKENNKDAHLVTSIKSRMLKSKILLKLTA